MVTAAPPEGTFRFKPLLSSVALLAISALLANAHQETTVLLAAQSMSESVFLCVCEKCWLSAVVCGVHHTLQLPGMHVCSNGTHCHACICSFRIDGLQHRHAGVR